MDRKAATGVNVMNKHERLFFCHERVKMFRIIDSVDGIIWHLTLASDEEPNIQARSRRSHTNIKYFVLDSLYN